MLNLVLTQISRANVTQWNPSCNSMELLTCKLTEIKNVNGIDTKVKSE